MDLNKFTEKAQAALQEAQNIATRRQHQAVEVEHLGFALLEQADGLVPRLIVNGASVDDVVRSFPELTRAQVYECLAYYEDHREEIDWRVAEQMAEAPA